MFSGIVQGVGKIELIHGTATGITVAIRVPSRLTQCLAIGASVNVDGVCLTVTEQEADLVTFDVIQHSLDVTNLSCKKVSDRVNLERSCRFGEEIGGHIVSGHVSTRATITAICTSGNRNFIEMKLGSEWMKYIFLQGFVAINGASLTVSHLERERGIFGVNLIPETLRSTVFSDYVAGDSLNIEIESQTKVLVDTLHSVLDERADFAHRELRA